MCPSDAPHLPTPVGSTPRSAAAGLVSNGTYWVLLDASGRGFSACGSHLLTAWNRDRCEEPGGLLVYLRDRDRGTWCDLGRVREDETDAAPLLEAEPGVVRLSRHFEGLEISMSVWVDPDVDGELREITVHNPTADKRSIELTSFAEIVLHDPAAHASHPIFSKLFLQTEWDGTRALLVHRRPRGHDEHFPTLVHALLDAPVTGYESDRGRFMGRGYPRHTPRAILSSDELSGTVGNVLDPALSLRTVVELEPGSTHSLTLLLGVGADRNAALALVEERASQATRTHSRERAMMRESERCASSPLDANEALRAPLALAAILRGEAVEGADPAVLERVEGSVSDLARWKIAPSSLLGFVDLEGPAGAAALAPALELHRCARAYGIASELVVVGRADESAAADGLHRIDAATLTGEDHDRLEALAHWLGRSATIAPPPFTPLNALPALERANAANTGTPLPETEHLRHPIEHGGFSADGSEYVIRLRRRDDGSWSRPPRPWINVLANETFGTLCSETGAGNTWSGNSREHRLTPWSNDSVLDPHSEACYVRDDETGAFWSPLPGPAPAGDRYEMRHGFGASRCVHQSHGLEQESTIFVPRHDALRIVIVRLRNTEARARRLSLFDHHRLVLGPQSARGEQALVTSLDADHRVVLARNGLGGEFARRTAFATAVMAEGSAPSAGWRATGDRTAFLGRGGSPEAPLVLREGGDLEAIVGAGLDPGLTQQLSFEIPAHGEVEIALLFGTIERAEDLEGVLARFASTEDVAAALEEVRAFWRERTDTLQVSSPSPEIDLMLNGWLTYQTVACRLWARSAFYQSGGAFGFRDQMQDATALVGLWPELAREQILLHAAHQFVEGDVLHWWHPPHSRGLRTRFADDLLWLPHLTTHYVRTTGELDLFDEVVPFRTARLLAEGEDEVFLSTELAAESATLYEHCCRAIDRSLGTGAHGLPLFGTGDWNDGMNRVGREGRGESTWMGFFLFTILEEMAPHCERRGDGTRAQRYRHHREQLRVALGAGGWDGHWYRRGYYDNGAPLGSAQSDECQIDALAQAWSVISGAAPPERAREAMDAVAARLVDEEHSIVRLLDPPFVNTPHDPGYIKGYVAGVRENGGQYTHAALWVVRAFAELGDHERAMQLLERISPVHHTRSDAAVERYQVEPYVVAADVYGVAPHIGRGGWTWYTGSSGWMVRVGLETMLGVSVEAGRWLVVAPRIPDVWPGFHVRYRPLGGATTYEIEVVNPDGCPRNVTTVRVDDHPSHPSQGRARIELVNDGNVHRVEIVLGDLDAQAKLASATGAAS